jgi:hypothetical protein
MDAMALSAGIYVFFFVSAATVMDRRLGWIGVALAPLGVLCFLDTSHALEWLGAYALLGGCALSWVWRRDARLARAREATLHPQH